MPNHILLLEPKSTEGRQLADKIEQFPNHRVHCVQTMREACSLLTEQTIDLALLPITRNDSLVYSLRMLQPEIPIILIAESDDQDVPERQVRAVRGIISKPDLLTSLPQMGDFISAPAELDPLFWHNRVDKKAKIEPVRKVSINPDRFSEIAQQLLQQPFIQFVMFLRGQEIIGYHNTGDQDQLFVAAQEVKSQWGEEKQAARSTQIQFIDQAVVENADDLFQNTLLLYTKPVGPYLMTIGAAAETPVSTLRQLVKRIRVQVGGGRAIGENLPLLLDERLAGDQPKPLSYVLVWKPVIAINAENRRALRKILPAIAHSEGFVLHHLILNENFVHVVANCPPQRTSAWLAQTLKHKSEAALQKRIGYDLPIWAKGYYAKASNQPLSAAELNRYLMLKA